MDAATRLRVSRKLRLRPSGDAEIGELNVVPYLDIVVNVVMFLLATAVVATPLVRIDVASGGRGVGPSSPPVTVAIAASGFHLSTQAGPFESVPRREGRYDFDGLGAAALRLARSGAQGPRVIVTADADVPYETVVRTLDALRSDGDGPLLPDVLLSAGIQ